MSLMATLTKQQSRFFSDSKMDEYFICENDCGITPGYYVDDELLLKYIAKTEYFSLPVYVVGEVSKENVDCLCGYYTSEFNFLSYPVFQIVGRI